MTNRTEGPGKAAERAAAALEGLLRDVPGELRNRVVDAVRSLIEGERQHERERFVAVCQRRAELWRRTTASRSPIALAREEARARANEALYLADLLRSGVDFSDFAASGSQDVGLH
jgi:hypothetical protein